MNRPAPSYHGYRFPAEIIAHVVWDLLSLSLSFRDVEDVLAGGAGRGGQRITVECCGASSISYCLTEWGKVVTHPHPTADTVRMIGLHIV